MTLMLFEPPLSYCPIAGVRGATPVVFIIKGEDV